VALFSNATIRLSSDLEHLSSGKEFDRRVQQLGVGSGQPSEQAFRAILHVLKARPADCIFVDDTARHVCAAAALGLRAHHFRSTAVPVIVTVPEGDVLMP
jgi:putative hydrolase of the HAD superfamily